MGTEKSATELHSGVGGIKLRFWYNYILQIDYLVWFQMSHFRVEVDFSQAHFGHVQF